VKAAYFYDPDGVALEIIQYLEDDNCGSFVMKALMKIQRGEGHIEFREVEDSKPGADEVLIEVKRACVCDKDIHILHCEFPKTRPPFILGHEFFDVVEVVGKEVREGRAEDRVVSETAAYSCGVCRFCQTGDTQLCLERKVYGHIVEMLL
jgi:L-iditol 2-dehydrogenase